ncbi:MAG: phosphoadenosine phosphosulfate reductase family protein [Eubacteriales bacterium]|nr:phosphoadenosine phosphosulfate reductase family protein [Eubacteriales bacterium]
MQSTELALRPSYWASVSGGKDSLFMLNLILHNLDKYPLDGVVHFELEIDYPFIKNVIDYMQSECERVGIRFLRIKPTKTWGELYEKYGFPTRVVRWCNEKYKLTAKKQLQEFMKTQGFYTVFYIGYCSDEEKRFFKAGRFTKSRTLPAC